MEAAQARVVEDFRRELLPRMQAAGVPEVYTMKARGVPAGLL